MTTAIDFETALAAKDAAYAAYANDPSVENQTAAKRAFSQYLQAADSYDSEHRAPATWSLTEMNSGSDFGEAA